MLFLNKIAFIIKSSFWSTILSLIVWVFFILFLIISTIIFSLIFGPTGFILNIIFLILFFILIIVTNVYRSIIRDFFDPKNPNIKVYSNLIKLLLSYLNLDDITRIFSKPLKDMSKLSY
jgi:hypothetical protein